MNRRLWLLLLLLPALAAAEDAWRDDFRDVTAWTPQPSWLGVAAKQPVAEVKDGVAHFAIGEPNRGMKWRREVDPGTVDLAPWLVFRYRATGYDTQQIDYLLWLDDSGKGRDGLKLLTGKDIHADGQWHTRVIDLAGLGIAPPINHLALQVLADAAGHADLWVERLAFTDTLPPDAEGYTPPAPPKQTVPVPLNAPDAWTLQPSWLANVSDRPGVAKTETGLRFTIAEAGRGGKWSYALPAPLTNLGWLSLRYRAQGLAPHNDYAVYLASGGGGKADAEQYAVKLNELLPDGAWHVVTVPVSVPTIHTVAVQVQAAEPDATFELGSLALLDAKPPVKLTDVVDVVPGWPAGAAPRTLALPAGNLDVPALGAQLGYTGGLPAGQVTIDGVPFQLRDGQAVSMTGVRPTGELAVGVPAGAAAVQALVAVRLPLGVEPSSQDPAGTTRDVDKFVARIENADGTVDEVMPRLLPRGDAKLVTGLHAYLVPIPSRAAKRVVFEDKINNGALGLLAANALADLPAEAAAWQPRHPAEPLPPRAEPLRERKVTVAGGVVTASNGFLQLKLDTTHGLLASGASPGSTTPWPLFRLQAGKLKLTSADFKVTGIDEVQGHPNAHRIDLTYDQIQPALSLRVWVDVTEDGELGLLAQTDFAGLKPTETSFTFPELGPLAWQDDPADAWYLLPRAGDAISNRPAGLREAYGGRAPLQVIAAWSQATRDGAYLMTQDLTALPRYYRVDKADGKVRLSVEYSPWAGGTTAKTVVGGTRGDWHPAFERYRRWVSSWYQPAAPRKDWFRRVFNFRQQFLSFGVPRPSGMFDPKTKSFHLNEVLKQDAEAFGGVDYLHLFDWGWDPVHGRCGDYVPWDYLGAPERFKQAIAGAGLPVGLYLEGYLIDPQSDIGKAKGQAWQLLDAAGKPYDYFAPSYNACAAVPEWQDYLAGTYGRVKRQTGAVGYYLDEYGFTAPNHSCYNPAHPHPAGATPVLGEREMLKKVRAALGPETAIYTEESPSDVNSQFQDGSFTYHVSNADGSLSPSRVNLYRFALPSFKTIEIIVCDHPLGTNAEAVRQVAFNGEAIWLEGIADRWFAPVTLAAIRQYHAVLRANAECFAGDHPTPLVPTLWDGVYANRFASRADGRGKTCWTLYNTYYQTLRGEVLAVDHVAGARYMDALTGQPVTVTTRDNRDYLSLAIGPRQVAVVSRTAPAG